MFLMHIEFKLDEVSSKRVASFRQTTLSKTSKPKLHLFVTHPTHFTLSFITVSAFNNFQFSAIVSLNNVICRKVNLTGARPKIKTFNTVIPFVHLPTL